MVARVFLLERAGRLREREARLDRGMGGRRNKKYAVDVGMATSVYFKSSSLIISSHLMNSARKA